MKKVIVVFLISVFLLSSCDRFESNRFESPVTKVEETKKIELVCNNGYCFIK